MGRRKGAIPLIHDGYFFPAASSTHRTQRLLETADVPFKRDIESMAMEMPPPSPRTEKRRLTVRRACPAKLAVGTFRVCAQVRVAVRVCKRFASSLYLRTGSILALAMVPACTTCSSLPCPIALHVALLLYASPSILLVHPIALRASSGRP